MFDSERTCVVAILVFALVGVFACTSLPPPAPAPSPFGPEDRVYLPVTNAYGILETIAGGHKLGKAEDGVQAFDAALGIAIDVALDADGTLYVAEPSRIRRIDQDGKIWTIAGTGTRGFSGDGGPAIIADIDVRDMLVDHDGNIVFTTDGRIRNIDKQGVITTVAGRTQQSGWDYVPYPGDGTKATSMLVDPYTLAMDANGRILFTDSYNDRIFLLQSDGTVVSLVGKGPYTGQGRFGGEVIKSSGDGGPASQADISPGFGLIVDQEGSIYFCEHGTVRKIGTDGNINTIAGIGNPISFDLVEPEFSGDGGPATKASIFMGIIALDKLGNLYISDTGNHRVRRVDRSGIIQTVIGTSQYCNDVDRFSRDCLVIAGGLEFDPQGRLLFADQRGRIVRFTPKNST